MNPALITVIALGVVLVVAWDGFCLRDLIRADPATVRYLGKGTWAVICLLSCPWGGLLYVIAGRGGFGSVLKGRGQPPGGQRKHNAGSSDQSAR